jgi:hypothetical protein
MPEDALGCRLHVITPKLTLGGTSGSGQRRITKRSVDSAKNISSCEPARTKT